MLPPLRRFLLLVLLASIPPAVLGAQSRGQGDRPAFPAADRGVLLLAHGGGPGWNAQVEAVAREVRHAGPVAVSFLVGPGAEAAPFQEVVAGLVARGAREVVVVPVLISSHSGHYEQVRWLAGTVDTLEPMMAHHLELGGIRRPRPGVPIRVTPALDDAPEMARLLAARARALDPDTSRALLLLGHGPNSAEDYAEWMGNLRRVAEEVRRLAGYRSVLVELVRDDAAPTVRAEAVARVGDLIRLQAALTGRDVLVVPVLVATGRVSREKFAGDLDGLPVDYRGDALLPDPSLARWVERRVGEM
ncbi:MAG TPA: CbiX/SirB N-terminal domain-containing protein [Gemmatimonadales bacterium]|nr:CbiX/SirB N-terminal domain-containing protein [Gemmatimonadales bacterium]